MNYILFDGDVRNQLLPFTYTRPVADIRIGILTIREKWEFHLGSTTSTITEDYLSDKWPLVEFAHNVMINAAYLPTSGLVNLVKKLKTKQAIFDGDTPVAFYVNEDEEVDFDSCEIITFEADDSFKIAHTWDIFSKNGAAIMADFQALTAERASQPISDTVTCIGDGEIFIEEGAKVEGAILNTTNGPIYLGKDSEVMEGSLIRGPFALGESSQVKMGAKIYGPTSTGPHCKIGGEVNNAVFFGYSSKGHDGFMGNSVIGEWCNWGADTNNSNLKNNYAPVKLWDYERGRFANTGLQFCGLMMGDHSKCGINTMFNTGTVIGVASNIYGGGFPRNFIPSFSWGGASGMVTHITKKAFETASIAMQRRAIELTAQDQEILQNVFEQTKQYRKD